METLSQQKETKARKQHRCNFCFERIAVNEKYMKSTHVYDGTIYDWKTHKYCAKLADRLNMYEDCDEGLTGDDFVEFVSEKYYDTLTALMTDDEVKKYSDIILQIRYVNFRQKLWHVIRHFNKIDKEAQNSTCT